MQRARFLYQRFLKLHLNKDTARLRAETVLAEINKVLPPEAKKAKVVNLLPMIDPRTGNVHVVNDSRVALEGARIEVTVDGRARRWTGNVDAD